MNRLFSLAVLAGAILLVGCRSQRAVVPSTTPAAEKRTARVITDFIVQQKHSDFTSFRFIREFASVKTYGVADDGTSLWCATARGVLRYEYKRGVWTVLGKEEGLPGDLVMSVATGKGLVFADVYDQPKPNYASPVGTF